MGSGLTTGADCFFAGRRTDAVPFVSQGGGIVYKGDAGQIQAAIAEGQQVPVNLTGVDVFGAVTSQVQGSKDLNPAATAITKLSGLNNGRGVKAGSVTLGDGVTTQTIDLSAAESLGDVIDKLNSNTLGIVASITTTGGAAGSSRITLTKPAFTLSVSEVNGNTTAADLGIKNAGTASPLNGTDLDPRLSDLTTLASLNNGTGGVDLASGLLIKNGTNTGTVTFTGLTTLQDVRNRLNGSGLFVDAQVSSDGRKLNLVSTLNGAEFRVSENGGTTGTDLGVLSMTSGTFLSGLNRALGVRKAALPADADFRITRRNGTTFDVNIAAASTIQDVLTAIATATGGTVTATMAGSGGNGIVLTDTVGGVGNLSVTLLNDSFAAQDLGIRKSVASATLTGDDVNPVVTGSVFSILTELQTALINNDTQAIDLRGTELDTAFTKLLDSRATAGGRLQRLEMTDNRLQEEQEQVQGFLSNTLDADLAELLTRLNQEQVSLQAALKVSATALQLSLINFL